MIRVGGRRGARSDADLRDYCCQACGHDSLALVVGVAQGRRETASANATLTLSLARCPACGRRDRVAVAWFWTRVASIVTGAVLAAWGFGGALYLLVADPVYVWVFGGIGLVVAPAFVWLESWKWTTVDRRVAFVEADLIGRVEGLSSPASLQPGR